MAGFLHSFVCVVIATLALLPETIAAGRAGCNRIQVGLKLALGLLWYDLRQPVVT